MRLPFQVTTLNSRGSHLPDFDYLIIKTFAEHLTGLDDASKSSREYSTYLEYIGYSSITQQRNLPKVEH